MFYLGVLFFSLAVSSMPGGSTVSVIFFMVLIVLLFLTNIPPRHKIMKLLEENGISVQELKHRGIRF